VLECDNPFWRFSLAVYAAPGVADECLGLQDTLGIDVNVLLLCAWLGSVRRLVLTADDLATIEAAARPWREAAVQPLRAARRAIKAMPDAASDAVIALRKDIAALELRAEQIEQAMLYRMAPTLGGTGAAPAADEATRRNIAAFLGNCKDSRDTPPALRLIEAALAYTSRR